MLGHPDARRVHQQSLRSEISAEIDKVKAEIRKDETQYYPVIAKEGKIKHVKA